MRKTLLTGITVLLLVVASNGLVYTQNTPNMSFFITSAGSGNGANLGGLAGADAICQKLAAAVGAGGRTWRAYLSAGAAGNQPAVNARDRIGKGPVAERQRRRGRAEASTTCTATTTNSAKRTRSPKRARRSTAGATPRTRTTS